MESSSSFSHSTPRSSSLSKKYDVFLSFRGADIRKTYVDHLYKALNARIPTYKDDQTLSPGESIGPSIFQAIEESRIAIIVFTKNYANSSWCLDEVAYIIKCRDEKGLILMPIFYNVTPSQVRKQEGAFGKAFAKQKEKNIDKAELWGKALFEAGNISGWEPKKMANGHESEGMDIIVNAVLNKLFALNSGIDSGVDSGVDEDPVGMRDRLQDLKSLLDVGSGSVRMVGIWGLGGSGKTTLAISLKKKISKHFDGHCVVQNVRDKTSKYGLEKLQESIILALFNKKENIYSVEEGKNLIKDNLCHRKVLVLLDDVSDRDQLKALAGKHNWFGSGSRIIITSRDEHLLIAHKVDEVYNTRLLSNDEAIQLFKRHAYNEKQPVEDYETLSLRVVSYCKGLPLALHILGALLYGRNKLQWSSALKKLEDTPNMDITKILKISYDELACDEKELFLDIACFWRWERPSEAMKALEACGYNPGFGIEVLRQKALISIVDDKHLGEVFDMHDLVQEMGHHIVRGEHPKSPEKHNRVWKPKEIENLCLGEATMENNTIKAIKFDNNRHILDYSSHFNNIVSNMKKLRWLWVKGCFNAETKAPTFLSNELLYLKWNMYPASPFPDSFQPTKLVVLILHDGFQRELWKGYKDLPHLKELNLSSMLHLARTPDFSGLISLRRLRLFCCYALKEIHPSLGNLTSLERLTIVRCPIKTVPITAHMKNLKSLEMVDCSLKDGVIPSSIGELTNLQKLDLRENKFSGLQFSLTQLTGLKLLNLSKCKQLRELPDLPSSLAILQAEHCTSLGTFRGCEENYKWLCEFSIVGSSIINHGRNYGNRLLQSMLEGEAIKNGYMLLCLGGVEVANGFSPPLRRGCHYRLQLPKNWRKDFSGFLMCAVVSYPFYSVYDVKIRMKHVMSGTNSKDYAVWKHSASDHNYKYTWVRYLSFDSLKHTPWWDQTYKAFVFDISFPFGACMGFGVRLIDQSSRSHIMETSTDYRPQVRVMASSYILKFSLQNSGENFIRIPQRSKLINW